VPEQVEGSQVPVLPAFEGSQEQALQVREQLERQQQVELQQELQQQVVARYQGAVRVTEQPD